MSKKKSTNTQNQDGVDLKDREDNKIEKPKKYKVIFHNDDFTPMDWVVILLMSEFRLGFEKATEIMLNIHESGKAIAGVFPKGIAQTKSNKCNKLSKEQGYPLLTEIEPE